MSQQDYNLSLLEVIVIDDFSEDETFNIANNYQANFTLKVFKLSEQALDEKTIAYKKKAIEFGISQTQAELIITTDADCSVQKSWISTFVNYYEQTNCQIIAAPVLLNKADNIFHKFQALDFCGMQIITAASLKAKMYNMANGANLAYTRNAFLKVEGYKNIDKQASGDDMLLIYKIAKSFPNQATFLKKPKGNCKNSSARKGKRFYATTFPLDIKI